MQQGCKQGLDLKSLEREVYFNSRRGRGESHIP